MFIPDPDVDFFFPYLGSRGKKGTGSRVRIRNTAYWPYGTICKDIFLFLFYLIFSLVKKLGADRDYICIYKSFTDSDMVIIQVI